MFSIGNGDGRKGLGIRGASREMEEGEAYFYPNEALDPDVTLSYLDEKLHHVLGHFQKDFEGGVSADNLGSKFGGYGSFLPTHQRSPTWAHSRTPLCIQNMSRSPNSSHLEAADCNSGSSSVLVPAKLGSVDFSVGSLPSIETSSVNGKREMTLLSTHAETTSESASDQKTLKVRIKMDFPTQKNAELYSGVGLDVSPNSSFGASSTENELFHMPLSYAEESPTSILEVMTSSPVHGSLLLSPLPYDLIYLIEKEKHLRESRFLPADGVRQESPLTYLNFTHSDKGDWRALREKRPKPSEKMACKMELKNDNGRNSQNKVGFPMKNDAEHDNLACEELVSSALRLPFLSNSYCSVGSIKTDSRIIDISRVGNKCGNEESVCDLARDEPLGPVRAQENFLVEKSNVKAGSDGMVWEFEKKIPDIESGFPVKGSSLIGKRPDALFRAYLNVSMKGKSFNTEPINASGHKTGQKVKTCEHDDSEVDSLMEQFPSGIKRGSQGSQRRGTQVIVEVPKDNKRTDMASAPKYRKTTPVNSSIHGTELVDNKKEVGEDRDRYTEFGVLELSQEDDELAKEMNSTEGEASTVVPPTGGKPVNNAAVPVVLEVNEDWVCCNECQKWRVLPAGKNPTSLPSTWQCSMLDWLDGMNCCNISEAETTEAAITLNQITSPGRTSSGVFHVDQSHQNSGVKKTHDSKDVLNETSPDSSTSFPNSKKKNHEASIKIRSLNSENQSSSLNEIDFQQSGQSSRLAVEKHRHKKKENSKLLENNPDDSKRLKMNLIRNQREPDQDFSKASKKLKIHGVHRKDKDWKSNNYGDALKVVYSSSSDLSKYETWKDQHKYDVNLKESKRDLKASIVSLEEKSQFDSNAAVALHIECCNDRDLMKKKESDCQDTELYSTSVPAEGQPVGNCRDLIEEKGENNLHKETKARLSKFGGNEISIIKNSCGADKYDISVKDQQALPDLGKDQSQRGLVTLDSVKNDIGSLQPLVNGSSCPSKVSGSHKRKSYLQEMKGSPVESVSSSPLRALSQDKFTSTRKNLGGKTDSQDFLLPTSPKKCFGRENGGRGDQSGMVKSNEIIAASNHGSLDSSVPDFQETDIVVSNSKSKADHVHSPEFSTQLVSNTIPDDPYPSKPQSSDQYHYDESAKGSRYHGNGTRQKSGKGSSRSKDKSRDTRSESDSDNLKSYNCNRSVDHSTYGEKSKARNKSQEKIGLCHENAEKNAISNKNPSGNILKENGVRECLSNFGSLGLDKQVVISRKDLKQHLLQDRGDEGSSMRFPSAKRDWMDVDTKGKSHSFPPVGRGQNETTCCPQPLSESHRENGASSSLVDATEGDDAFKAPKKTKKAENQNGSQLMNSRHPTNAYRVRDVDTPSPVRRNPSSQAANIAVKEATDLKHLADRLKNSGSTVESTGIYFQAVLKFLHGASLLESCCRDNVKNGEMVQSMQVYSSTAALCKFCAREFEKSKDMASAALAYKCEEVAYLRVINSSHASVSKDRHELHGALQIAPLGESPFSSASDVDNLNNLVTADKVLSAKGVNSPLATASHVIPAQNRHSFMRLLKFAEGVNFAMEASRKSRTIFAAANLSLEETKCREGLSSVKKALDFNFQDVEGFLRLVRLAMEAISH